MLYFQSNCHKLIEVMSLVEIFIPVNKTNENITRSNNWKSFFNLSKYKAPKVFKL